MIEIPKILITYIIIISYVSAIFFVHLVFDRFSLGSNKKWGANDFINFLFVEKRHK